MFTGIIQEIGTIERITRASSLATFAIATKDIYKNASVSDSISINGVCLTVTAKEKNILSFTVVGSTLEITTLTQLKKGDKVNCEAALKVGDKLGGHFVLGHIDVQLRLRRLIRKSSYWQLEIILPARYSKYVIENGSIAIDGISLTVKNVYPRFFRIDVVPFTFKHTTLQYRKAGDWLNIEFDYLLKRK